MGLWGGGEEGECHNEQDKPSDLGGGRGRMPQ